MMSSLEFYHRPHHHAFSSIPHHIDTQYSINLPLDASFPGNGDVSNPFYDHSAAIVNAIALLPPTSATSCTSAQAFPSHHQSGHLFNASNLPPAIGHGRQDSVVAAFVAQNAHDWQPMYQPSMSAATTTRRPFKRVRTHERTPSASTVGTQDGPASPFNNTTSYPVIANSDYSPNSPAYHYSDQSSYAKQQHLLTPQQTPTDTTFVSSAYIPSQVSHAPSTHLAMKGFAPFDYSISDDIQPPEFYQSSRQSMSSGHASSPATPQSNAGESYDQQRAMMQQNDFRQPNPSVSLYHSDSQQAYQDELYNPMNYTSTPVSTTPKQPSNFLSPHRTLVTERLQVANMARSASPRSAMSRERSPFRDGSPLAPAHEWAPVGTASSIRQKQKEEAEQAEYAQHMPTLRREPTKTISPKDAMLDYNEPENQQPLFQEQIPVGYKQHSGGAESWQTSFNGQPGATFGNLTVPVSNTHALPTFRSTNDSWGANLGYMHLPQQEQAQIPTTTSFPSNAYAAPRMVHYQESNPEFPAQLTSMESSMSDGGPPLSSQNSLGTPGGMQRPVDTRANTGTYTCTYHGCTDRFNSHVDLQRHKRDAHRTQHLQSLRDEASASATPSATDSVSPRSTESPAPSGTGMTSAAILARNSQAGPHKCTRINPSTGKPCNTIFSRPYDLTRHEDTIHNNRKQKVRCPYCREEKTFSRNDALTRHMRVVHPEVEAYGKRSRRGD